MPEIYDDMGEQTELDPFYRNLEDHQDEREELSNQAETQLTPDNPETDASNEEEKKEKFEEKFNLTHNIPVYGQLKEHVLDPMSLGLGDFTSDAIGLVPWLKPLDDWWDENSARSNNPAHTLIRDASSVIIPSLVGGSMFVGGAKAAAAAKAITLPSYVKTLGTIAAYAGVDVGVAMISSHSKTDDNIAGTLHNWLGWDIPWATKPGDDPDTRWKKNVYETAGLAAGVELLGAAFSFANKAKFIPRDDASAAIIAAKEAKLNSFDDPLTASVQPRIDARAEAQVDEAIAGIKADPDGLEYNPFIHDLGDDGPGKGLVNLEPDPLEAKLHQYQIQNSLGTKNGRAASVTNDEFTKSFAKAIDGNDRAKHLDELFDSISPNADAIIDNGVGPVQVNAEDMNDAVDKLTQAIYGKDISFPEFEILVDDMKTTIFNSNEMLDEEGWVAASQAFKSAYDKMFDPNQMRASAMLVQQSADNVTDAATAAKLLGDNVDTSRQFQIMFDKLNLLDNEIRVNKYIASKADEYKSLKASGNIQATVAWMNRQSNDFEGYLKTLRTTSQAFNEQLLDIAKTKPHFLDPLKEAYYATNGDVDTLHKLHRWTESKFGLLKKGIIDNDPEVSSLFVKGLQATRVTGLLSGLSASTAAIGNAVFTAIKPAAVFAGATLSGDAAVFKRALYTFGGVGENFKRGFKVLRNEWNLANQFPEDAMMRGRADLRFSEEDALKALDKSKEAYRIEGEWGKVAMINMAQAVTWWPKQKFVKYGTNALYAIDGMTNSFMASGMARARAYDDLLSKSKGSIVEEAFQTLQKDLYDNAFDVTGKLTDEAAKFASQEIALNLDNKVVKALDNLMDHVPAAKGLFLFPRTGVNMTELAWSFNPASSLGPALTRARKTLSAVTAEQKLEVLFEHGIDSSQNADLAFRTLKSEYIGRQIAGGSVIMGAGFYAVEGNLTGSGSHDPAEKRRMISMGFKPYSIRNPITGEWRSYKGIAPFDTLLGLTADVVYQAKRVDSSITEEFFQKAAASISHNITNDTFISGFEPLVGLFSNDPTAWTRFFAQQTDMLIPYKGVRSILNNAIAPQLKDVENDFLSYMQNYNKFIFKDELEDLLDVYTGEPINYFNPLEAAANALLPMFKTNGGDETWRQWLLSTGWDGLQKPRKNRYTGLDLSPEDRAFINNHIAKNGNLVGRILQLMEGDDGYWKKQIKEYSKLKMMKPQHTWDIKNLTLYHLLDEMHDEAFEAAMDELGNYNRKYTVIGRELENLEFEMRSNQLPAAAETSDRVNTLLKETQNR